MKKSFLFVAALAFVASMSSCKKEYTCTCKYDQGGVSAEVSYTFEAKKSDAEDACNAYVSTAGSGYTCTLD